MSNPGFSSTTGVQTSMSGKTFDSYMTESKKNRSLKIVHGSVPEKIRAQGSDFNSCSPFGNRPESPHESPQNHSARRWPDVYIVGTAGGNIDIGPPERYVEGTIPL